MTRIVPEFSERRGDTSQIWRVPELPAVGTTFEAPVSGSQNRRNTKGMMRTQKRRASESEPISGRPPRGTRVPVAVAPDALLRWRRETRVQALRALVERARGLLWSPVILEALLVELHVDDQVIHLVGEPRSLGIRAYPQVIAVALALRHSWRHDDLSALIRRLRLPPRKRGRAKKRRGA